MTDASKLKTYYSYHCESIVLLPVTEGHVRLLPGDLVTHKEVEGSVGVLVNRDDGLERSVTVLWSHYDDSWKTFAMPAIRGLTTHVVASQVINVQPMSMPNSSIFYLDYSYGPMPDDGCKDEPEEGKV